MLDYFSDVILKGNHAASRKKSALSAVFQQGDGRLEDVPAHLSVGVNLSKRRSDHRPPRPDAGGGGKPPGLYGSLQGLSARLVYGGSAVAPQTNTSVIDALKGELSRNGVIAGILYSATYPYPRHPSVVIRNRGPCDASQLSLRDFRLRVIPTR